MNVGPFRAALGEDFDALPAGIRSHFGMSDGTLHYRGSMARVWRRSGLRGFIAAPALRLASTSDILFADTGKDVGFSLSHRIQRGDTDLSMVWAREFRFPRVCRRFDAVMQYSAERGCIVDWLGSSGRLEVELHVHRVHHGLQIVSGKQWLRLGRANLRLPNWIVGKATIREWIDHENAQRIEVTINNPLLGDFFGYEGTFEQVESSEGLNVPCLSPPRPGIVVPLLKWFVLAMIAIVGTVAVAKSFSWTHERWANPQLLDQVGAAVGVGAGLAWIVFGATLLLTARTAPAVRWADACLETMAVGMAVLSTIVATNVLSHHNWIHVESLKTLYMVVVGVADIAMAAFFSRRAMRLGLPLWKALTLWLLVLNGTCAAVVALWLGVSG